MIAEFFSWIVLAVLVFCFLVPKGKGLQMVLLISILFIPILVPSTASSLVLRGSIFRLVSILILLFVFIYKGKFVSVPPIGSFKYYLIFIFICVVSAVASVQPLESTLRALSYMEPFTLFLLALVVSYNNADGFKRINNAILASLAIVASYGIVQIIAQRDLLAEINFTEPMSFLGRTISYMEDKRTFSGRIASFLAQPVYAAFFFISCMPVAFFYYLKERKRKLFYMMFLITICILIYTTGTRSAYITLVILILTVLMKFGGRDIKVAIFIILLAYIFVGFVLTDEALHYMEESFDITGINRANANAFQRIDLTGRLLEIGLRNLWLGFGPGVVQKSSVGVVIGYNPYFEGLGGQENHYFAIFADTGILGLFAYLLFLVNWFMTLKKRDLPDDLELYRKLLLLGSLAFFLGSLTVSNLTSVPMVFLFVILGNYLGRVARLGRFERNSSISPRDFSA